MVSSAILEKKHVFKDHQNRTSPKEKCNLKSLKNSRETILLLVNNTHEKISSIIYPFELFQIVFTNVLR